MIEENVVLLIENAGVYKCLKCGSKYGRHKKAIFREVYAIILTDSPVIGTSRNISRIRSDNNKKGLPRKASLIHSF